MHIKKKIKHNKGNTNCLVTTLVLATTAKTAICFYRQQRSAQIRLETFVVIQSAPPDHT